MGMGGCFLVRVGRFDLLDNFRKIGSLLLLLLLLLSMLDSLYSELLSC